MFPVLFMTLPPNPQPLFGGNNAIIIPMGNREKEPKDSRWRHLFRRKPEPKYETMDDIFESLGTPFRNETGIEDEKLGQIWEFMSHSHPIGTRKHLLQDKDLKELDPEERDKKITSIYGLFDVRVPLEIIESDPDLQAKFEDIQTRNRRTGGAFLDQTNITFVQTITQITDRFALVRETAFVWRNTNQVVDQRRDTYSLMATDPRKKNVPIGQTVNVYG